MSIAKSKLTAIEEFALHLARLSESRIDQLIESGALSASLPLAPQLIIHTASSMHRSIGSTTARTSFSSASRPVDDKPKPPSRRCASRWRKDDLLPKRRKIGFAWAEGSKESAIFIHGGSAARGRWRTKQSASFEGDMRGLAAQLMDRFNLQKLFRLKSCADLFGSARGWAHYTSLLRYPVLHWQTKRPKNEPPVTGWFDYSGGDSAFESDMLLRSVRADFEPEVTAFKSVWFVPFGPVPAMALQKLAERGLIDREKILRALIIPRPLNETGTTASSTPRAIIRRALGTWVAKPSEPEAPGLKRSLQNAWQSEPRGGQLWAASRTSRLNGRS